MITQEFDRGNPVILADSRTELIRYLRKQKLVDFSGDKLKPRPDGKWQYIVKKSKKKD